MTAHHVAHRPPGPPGEDHTDITGWRLKRLLAAGFSQPLAMRLATTPGADLHALLDLVDRGCPPDLAARILDPVADTDLPT
ncbi:MAG: hypothetical protein ACM3ML_32600 [Micromonosporaceae bacterium]